MSAIENIKERIKEFKPTSWSVANKTTIYLIMLIVTLWGGSKFFTLPKEQFPDIVIPNIYVQTIYFGNSPKDIENLVTRPIEKQIKGITGAKIKKFTSTSQQDFSAIIVEFDTDVKTEVALQKVKDAIDKAKQDLPTDLTEEPTALEVNLSDQPIMYVNLSGEYDMMRLKKFADDLQDKLEELPQINRIDIVGAHEREFQINVDNNRMQAAGITLMRGDPRLVPAALDISRRTYAKIRQNLFWAFVYNLIGIPLAAFGYLNPVLAGAAMALSSASVVSNALLLKTWKPKDPGDKS